MKGIAIHVAACHRELARACLTESELASVARQIVTHAKFPDAVKVRLMISTWPYITTTKVSWSALYGSHELTGDRYLALRQGAYVVYHDRVDLADGAIPPIIAGPDWWKQAVSKFMLQIVNELKEWRDSKAPYSRSVVQSSIPEGVMPYVLV